jgi:hypothetical protein
MNFDLAYGEGCPLFCLQLFGRQGVAGDDVYYYFRLSILKVEFSIWKWESE